MVDNCFVCLSPDAESTGRQRPFASVVQRYGETEVSCSPCELKFRYEAVISFSWRERMGRQSGGRDKSRPCAAGWRDARNGRPARSFYPPGRIFYQPTRRVRVALRPSALCARGDRGWAGRGGRFPEQSFRCENNFQQKLCQSENFSFLCRRNPEKVRSV